MRPGEIMIVLVLLGLFGESRQVRGVAMWAAVATAVALLVGGWM